MIVGEQAIAPFERRAKHTAPAMSIAGGEPVGRRFSIQVTEPYAGLAQRLPTSTFIPHSASFDAGQDAPSKQQHMSISHSFLAEFESELPTTRRFLERVPAEQLLWKPHSRSMSAGQLALHIATVPMSVLTLSLHDHVEPPSFDEAPPQPDTLRDVIDAFDESTSFVQATLPTLTDDRLLNRFVVALGSKTLFDAPRAIFLRAIMFNHLSHHRGQLGVYLRMLGASVPSSYGPSGDESPF
jgi:uncharacterized damage-inducible protein DinB